MAIIWQDERDFAESDRYYQRLGTCLAATNRSRQRRTANA